MITRQFDECIIYQARISCLPADIASGALFRRLPHDEQVRIARLRQTDDQHRSQLGLYLLECALRDTGLSWRWDYFTRDRARRPMLRLLNQACPWDFNISHAGDIVVCAVGLRRLGIDIERRIPVELADFRHVLPAQILQRLLTTVDPLPLFYQWWTRAESVLKAVGCGFGGEVSALDVTGCEVVFSGHRWRCHDLDLAPDYACCLATLIEEP